MEHPQRSEMPVVRRCDRLGLEQANVSQHLAVLRNKRPVDSRKQGYQTFYRLRDPPLAEELELLRPYFLSHISEMLQMLREERAASDTEAQP
jgi:DNA-binding transcriptional ArsR family regulator